MLEDLNKQFKVLRPILMKLNSKHPNEFRGEEFLKSNREFEEFINHLEKDLWDSSYYDGTNVVREYLIAFFNEYANFLENESFEIELIPLKTHIPKDLTLDTIKDALNNCDSFIEKEEYGAAVTMAKSLLEGTFKEIILKANTDFTFNKQTNFPTLKKQAFEILNIKKSEDYPEDVVKLIGNLTTIVDTVSNIRNENGISHLYKEKVKLHHALLVVNATKTVMTFLFQSYEFQSKKNIDAINS